MPLGIHALNVGIVVLTLATITRASRRIRTNSTTYEQAGSRADRRSLTATYRSTGNSTNCRTDDSTSQRCLIGRLLATTPANLTKGKITTNIIISTKMLH